MRNLNHIMDRLINRRWKLPILVFLLMVLGIFFAPPNTGAQAVPPRSQTLQIIRPIVRPPEPPLEKEIRETNQEINKNRRGLIMTQQELEKTRRSIQQTKSGYQTELDKLLRYPKSDKDVKVATKECKAEKCEECIDHFVKTLNDKTAGRQSELVKFLRDPEHDTDVENLLRECERKQCKSCVEYLTDVLLKIKSLYVKSGHP